MQQWLMGLSRIDSSLSWPSRFPLLMTKPVPRTSLSIRLFGEETKSLLLENDRLKFPGLREGGRAAESG